MFQSTNFDNDKIMKAFNKSVVLPLILLLFSLLAVSQVFAQIPDEIILSLKSGNAKVLATYFNQNVELVIPEHDNVYSKAQAEQIVPIFRTKSARPF